MDQVGQYVVHHILDSQSWTPLPGVHLHIPKFLTYQVGSLPFTLTTHMVMVGLAAAFMMVAFLLFLKRKPNEAPKGFSNALEYVVVFVRDEIAVKNMGPKMGKTFAPFFLTLFFLVFTLNFMGLVPALATATANINFTGALALVVFLIMVLGGLLLNGPIKFWKAFLPAGLPWWLKPLMFVIEITSMFIRVGALCLRLFANMLGGHIVIGILVGLVLAFQPWGLLALPLALFIYVLEILVAFLQAYIFCLLSAIFIAGMLHPEH